MTSLYHLNGSLQPFAKLLFLPAAVLISIWVVTTTPLSLYMTLTGRPHPGASYGHSNQHIT
ncbi:hypothetical protein LB505_008909 [Fusarium chuoi]|nr:hypothetical protein LB505_008909 [Fusarium chuoi]